MSENIFKTAYSEHLSEPSEAGKKFQNEYGYKINKNGQKVLELTGKTNIYEKIQADLEDTKIENILARAAIGDMSHFKPDGIYADVSEMPKTLIEAKRQINELENMWARLPRELKEKYDNDVETFVGKSGTTEWLKDMGIITDSKTTSTDILGKPMPEAPKAEALGETKGENET